MAFPLLNWERQTQNELVCLLQEAVLAFLMVAFNYAQREAMISQNCFSYD